MMRWSSLATIAAQYTGKSMFGHEKHNGQPPHDSTAELHRAWNEWIERTTSRRSSPPTLTAMDLALFGSVLFNKMNSIEERLMSKMEDVMAGIAAVKTDFEAFRDGVNKALSDAAANATNPADVQAAVDAIAALDSEIKSSGAVASAPAPVQAAAAPTDASAPSA